MSQPSQIELIRDLRERLRDLERSQRRTTGAVLATGTALDQLLPEQGLAPGTLVEWLSGGVGSGAGALALTMAAPLVRNHGIFVVIDGRRDFYPPAAAALGIPLEQTVLVRPSLPRDLLWVWEQALRCPAVAVALGWIDTLPDRAFRRLQLAAETGGSLGFLLRSAACRAEPSWAEVRFLVAPLTIPSFPLTTTRRLRIEVLHCRGGAKDAAAELELNDETGHVRLVAPLADPTSARRTRRGGA